jgi:hypothetical protein
VKVEGNAMDTFKFGLKGVNAHQEHLVDGSRN